MVSQWAGGAGEVGTTNQRQPASKTACGDRKVGA